MTQTPTTTRHHPEVAPVVPLRSSPLPGDVIETAARALAGCLDDDHAWAVVGASWKDTFRRLAHRSVTDVIAGETAADRDTTAATPRQVDTMTAAATRIVDRLTPQFRTSPHPAAAAARTARVGRVRAALLNAVSLHIPATDPKD